MFIHVVIMLMSCYISPSSPVRTGTTYAQAQGQAVNRLSAILLNIEGSWYRAVIPSRNGFLRVHLSLCICTVASVLTCLSLCLYLCLCPSENQPLVRATKYQGTFRINGAHVYNSLPSEMRLRSNFSSASELSFDSLTYCMIHLIALL